MHANIILFITRYELFMPISFCLLLGMLFNTFVCSELCDYEMNVLTVISNSSTNMNKMKNHLLPCVGHSGHVFR